MNLFFVPTALLLTAALANEQTSAAKTPTLLLQMKGSAIGEKRPNPAPDSDGEELLCFDVPILDLATGAEIGTGTDCLTVAGPDTCGGLQVTATTVFNLDGRGTLMATGLTSVQPTTFGSAGKTHITGAIPGEGDDESIVYADGVYAGATGTARLSGAVDMSEVESEGRISFDCIFLVYLDNLQADPSAAAQSQALQAMDGTERMILHMKGRYTLEMRTNPDPSSDEQVPCFDITITDLAKGEVVGTGTDCLSIVPVDPEECGGLQVTATTVFDFLTSGDRLAAKGLTSVRPTTFGSPGKTHITGAVPAEGEESILFGEGKYEGATGTVRLSGAVDMSKMDSDKEAAFDCIFIVDVKLADTRPTIKSPAANSHKVPGMAIASFLFFTSLVLAIAF